MEELNLNELYEMHPDRRLSIVLDTIISIVKNYGGLRFKEVIENANEIKADLAWGGYDEVNNEKASNDLLHARQLLMKCDTILSVEDFREMKKIIEPLEMCITDLQMGYCD